MAIIKKELIDTYKNSVLNIGVIVLSLVIAGNIYKKELLVTAALQEKRDIENKKNMVLNDISFLEKKISAYKNTYYKKEPSMIITTVGGIAKDKDVKILSVRPEGEKEFETYTKYFFSLSLVAKDYHVLGNFLSAVESYSDVYMVEKINIRPNASAANNDIDGEIGAQITLSTVFFK